VGRHAGERKLDRLTSLRASLDERPPGDRTVGAQSIVASASKYRPANTTSSRSTNCLFSNSVPVLAESTAMVT
jgi:hypothetical protein